MQRNNHRKMTKEQLALAESLVHKDVKWLIRNAPTSYIKRVKHAVRAYKRFDISDATARSAIEKWLRI